MAQRKYTIADALGLSGKATRDLTKGYQREVRAIPRGARYQGAISRSRPTAAQELAQLLTPDTRGGAEFAQKLTPAIENVPLLGGLLSLVDARRQYQAGNTGQAAGLGILAALGAVPGSKGGSKALKDGAEDVAGNVSRAFKDFNFDPSYKINAKQKGILDDTSAEYEYLRQQPSIPSLRIEDVVGRPFISTMFDRTAANKMVTKINGTNLDIPVRLDGGQNFIFTPTSPDLIGANSPEAVSAIINTAEQLKRDTGKTPIFIPFRMGGEGSDFATMTGETMMSYLNSALGSQGRKKADAIIKKYIPDFAGVSSSKAYKQFQSVTGDKRKAIQTELSQSLSGEGGLNLNQTRAIVGDADQFDKRAFTLQNVAEFDPNFMRTSETGHPSYPEGFFGTPLGKFEDEINVTEFLPAMQNAYGIKDPFNFIGANTTWTPEQAAARGLKSLVGNPGRRLRTSVNSGIITDAMAEKIIGRRK